MHTLALGCSDQLVIHKVVVLSETKGKKPPKNFHSRFISAIKDQNESFQEPRSLWFWWMTRQQEAALPSFGREFGIPRAQCQQCQHVSIH